MNTTVKVGNNEFNVTLVRISPSDCSLATYVKDHGNGDSGWGNIKIEGQWLSETYSWHNGRYGKPSHSHMDMVGEGLAVFYGGAVPMNETGLDMACRRIQWLASREPELIDGWLYIKTELEKRSRVGDVSREEIQQPVTEVKPWREGTNPHPEALVYDLPGRKGSLPWWYTMPQPEGIPSGHPRFLCHFPATVPRDEWFGKKHLVKARIWSTAHRNDNGPSYNYATTSVKVIEGEFKGIFLGQKAVGFHYEPVAVGPDGKEVGWFGELPETPVPPQPERPYKNGEICNLNSPNRHTSADGEAVEVEIPLYVYWPDPVKVLLIKA